MYLLHRIGPRISSNWNTLDEILESEGPISFDGIYTEVFEHYKALKGKDVIFFVMGKYVGADNSFDVGETPGRYCTWPQIIEMVEFLGAKIGYHGCEHKRCVGLSSLELYREIFPSIYCGGLLAWPHGVCNLDATKLAESMGYTEAWCAGPHGDGSQFQRKRRYLNW